VTRVPSSDFCLQRYFWLSYYGSSGIEVFSIITKLSVMVSYAAVEVLMFLLFIAYHHGSSPAFLSTYLIFILYMFFLTALALLLAIDDKERQREPSYFKVTDTQTMIILLILASNIVMTIAAAVDLIGHPRPE
jgi:hypothetical protein